MSKRTPSITTLPQSPDEERRGRMIRYLVANGVRVVCIIAAVFLQGWLQLAAIVAAAILPYIAVVTANVVTHRPEATVMRPGSVAQREVGQ
jgi:xanthine/uracil permease